MMMPVRLRKYVAVSDRETLLMSSLLEISSMKLV